MSELRKGEFVRRSYIDEKDEHEKEVYLKELESSLHNYIRTGVKNQQLDDLIELEEEFKQKYEEQFDTKKIAKQISELSKDRMIETVREYREKNNETVSIELAFKLWCDETSDKIHEIVIEIVYDKLNEIIKDTAYLSHMNMLFELYEKEEQLRREEEEYDRISEKYQKMADILKSLSKQRRMELEQLQEQTDISKEELEKILIQNSKYFNMREKIQNIQVSMSPSGKKFYDYIVGMQGNFSREISNQLIYKNCDKLMEALENSYDGGLEYELKLEKLSPDRERALQSKYHTIAQKFISDHEEIYTAKIFEMRREKESVYEHNEKNRITIPREWDYEIN